MVWTVILTGGIGSGKSAVAARFATRGVPVVDADVAAREVVAPDSEGLGLIRDQLGARFIDGSGTLDRRTLRRAIFNDPTLRHRLDALLHPLIYARLDAELAALDAPYALLVVPLLLESGGQRRGNRILVVDCPPGLQIARVCARDGVTETEAQAIIAAQAPREERLAAADDVIDNSDGLDALDHQVERLHRRYLQLAANA